MNEEVDPALVIRRLKLEVLDLKHEIKILRGEENDENKESIEETKQQFKKELKEYCDADTDQELNLNKAMTLIRYGHSFSNLVKQKSFSKQDSLS